MRTLKVDEFERALRRPWPRLMDVRDISDFTGWTRLSVLEWIRDGSLTGARHVGDGKTQYIPREIVFAQLDPRNRGDSLTN